MSKYGGYKTKSTPRVTGNFANAQTPKQAASVVPQGDRVKPVRHVQMNEKQHGIHPGAMKHER